MRDIIAELKAEKAELDLKKTRLFDYLHSVDCAKEIEPCHKDLMHRQLTGMVDYSTALRDRIIELEMNLELDGIGLEMAKGQTFIAFEDEKHKAGLVKDGYISNGETWYPIDSLGGRSLMRQYHL